MFFAGIRANVILFLKLFKKKEKFMETKVAVVAIVVEDRDSDYADYIIGRMGIPYRAKKINIISVVVDAPHDVISALSGKIGSLKGVTARTVYSGAGE